MEISVEFSITTIISVVGLSISLIVLFIQIRANRIQKLIYFSAVDSYFDSNTVVKLVSSKQINEKVSIKLVIYNLDSKPVLIQSLSICRKVISKNIIKKLLNYYEFKRIPDSYWWPKYQEDAIEIKQFADEYQNILIKDMMDIQIVFDGNLYKDLLKNDKDIFSIIVNTNRGRVTHYTPLNMNGCSFSHSFNESRSYNC